MTDRHWALFLKLTERKVYETYIISKAIYFLIDFLSGRCRQVILRWHAFRYISSISILKSIVFSWNKGDCYCLKKQHDERQHRLKHLSEGIDFQAKIQRRILVLITVIFGWCLVWKRLYSVQTVVSQLYRAGSNWVSVEHIREISLSCSSPLSTKCRIEIDYHSPSSLKLFEHAHYSNSLKIRKIIEHSAGPNQFPHIVLNCNIIDCIFKLYFASVRWKLHNNLFFKILFYNKRHYFPYLGLLFSLHHTFITNVQYYSLRCMLI